MSMQTPWVLAVVIRFQGDLPENPRGLGGDVSQCAPITRPINSHNSVSLGSFEAGLEEAQILGFVGELQSAGSFSGFIDC
jgi:hypothetical protein